jgi:signal transduction histidine kinase
LFLSIRWRLAASYAALILLSVTLMASFALYIVQRYVGRQEGESLRENARAVAVQARRFLEPRIRRIALEELASTSAFLGDARVRIMDSGRAVLADSGAPGRSDEFLWLIPSGLAEIDSERRGSLPFILPMPPRPHDHGGMAPRDLMPLLRDLPLGTSHLYARRMPTPWGRRFVFAPEEEEMSPQPGERAPPPRQIVAVTLPVGPAGNPLGWVEVSSPLSLSSETLRPVQNAVVLSGLASLAIAVAAGLLIGRTISDPLRSLAGTARRMAQGDLGARAASARRDEIGDLALQFNGMAESLERSFRDLRSERDSLKRFVADASHELRTPITALVTFNELLQGRASEDPSARQEFLRESQAQLARLHWITSNLLDLSRLDAGIASLSIGSFAAADIVEAAVAAFRAGAAEKNVSLLIDTPDPSLMVSCDSTRMEMALTNLVGNAVKFVQENGTVTVQVKGHDGRAIFVVRDNGPGISAEDLPLVFDRFYRGRNATPDGAGLGLAIAQSIARAHGGDIRVQSAAGEGSVFALDIPLTPPTV